jgi:hypothetical protein
VNTVLILTVPRTDGEFLDQQRPSPPQEGLCSVEKIKNVARRKQLSFQTRNKADSEQVFCTVIIMASTNCYVL